MVYVFRIGYVEMNITIKFVAEKWSEELASDTTHAFFLLAGKIKQNVSEISMYSMAHWGSVAMGLEHVVFFSVARV